MSSHVGLDNLRSRGSRCRRTNRLTDGGPSATPELPSHVAGLPLVRRMVRLSWSRNTVIHNQLVPMLLLEIQDIDAIRFVSPAGEQDLTH